MSFRLQRQRGTLPSQFSPWFVALLAVSFSAFMWLPKHDTPIPQSTPQVVSENEAPTSFPLPNPEEAALAPTLSAGSTDLLHDVTPLLRR
jgi:hypothetical protein